MLTNLPQQPADALLALIKLHNVDPRTNKIDLGVGVYRTGQGDTPVFSAIKAAEKILLETEETKAYLGPEGNMGFVEGLKPYIFGRRSAPLAAGRIDGMQAPGGTGALRLAFAMAKRAGVPRFWMGTPSWPNHAQIFADLGCELKTFAHNTAAGDADMEALRAAVAAAEPGDAILLHGCCHNPTGIDYTAAEWEEIAGLIAGRGLLPILDLAYQGLGQGMEEDAVGVRGVLDAVPEALIAYSCDKNFGLYRDRVGAIYVMMAEAGQLPAVMSNGHALARASWSQPPDHRGAYHPGRRRPDPPLARRTRLYVRAHPPGARGTRRGWQGRRRRLVPDRPAAWAVLDHPFHPRTSPGDARTAWDLFRGVGPDQRCRADAGEHRYVPGRCGGCYGVKV